MAKKETALEFWRRILFGTSKTTPAQKVTFEEVKPEKWEIKLQKPVEFEFHTETSKHTEHTKEVWYCWKCGIKFGEHNGIFCETCETFKCPTEKHCLCTLTPEERKVAEHSMMSYYGGTTKKRRKSNPITKEEIFRMLKFEFDKLDEIFRREAIGEIEKHYYKIKGLMETLTTDEKKEFYEAYPETKPLMERAFRFVLMP